MPDLLIELFSEEIPARMQARAAEDLKKKITDGLVDGGLTYAGAQAFSTPRRLTLVVQDLLAASPTLREERKGPKVGAPDKAIQGFLRGAGLTRDQLEERDTPKGAVYFATIEKPGRPADDIVAEVLEATIRNFPWPKSMRWGAGALRWVRPLQSILCVLSDEAGTRVVPMAVDTITAGNSTQGHRFMAPDAFTVTGFDDYATKLKAAHVILSAEDRAAHIWADASNMAFAAGLEVVEDKGLLAEVAGLVEWPVVLMGEIGAEFLDLPPEVLQTSMKEHQKFFSVKNPKTGRIERFITVANRETADQGATILAGNQKVLSARLADAKFFWENDLRTVRDQGFEPWVEKLDNVTFHAKLGSQGARVNRIAALAMELAPAVGADPQLAQMAAQACKGDLSSEMVYEFPELQGLMGRYYAKAAELPAEVGQASQEHYSPLGPSDDVPTAPVSVAVALADKLDTLTGFWAIDEKPTGSKDPYALRRAALGVIRLVLENGLKLPLLEVIDKTVEIGQSPELDYVDNMQSYVEANSDKRPISAAFEFALTRADGWSPSSLNWQPEDETVNTQAVPDADRVVGIYKDEHGWPYSSFDRKARSRADTSYMPWSSISPNGFLEKDNDLLSFFHDRLKVFLRDEGIRHDVIDACIAMEGNDDLTLLVKRARALNAVIATEDGENLVQGFKRANNILTQAEDKDGVEYSYGADVKFAETDSERALFAALDAAEAAIAPALRAEDFPAAMSAMAALRGPVDAFFEDVQVNTDNDTVRRNRLNLLSQIRKVCGQVADLTRIGG